jgi:hypothetical protein
LRSDSRVAAISRYGFGPCDPEAVATYSFSTAQLEDFEHAHDIVGELATLGDDDVSFQTWSQAVYLISNPTWWRAIECIAVSVSRDPLTGPEVRRMIEEVASEQ